jgi:hypothetical protein
MAFAGCKPAYIKERATLSLSLLHWGNLDPKPNSSIGLYTCLHNNPIRNNDILGDTIGINTSIYQNETKNAAMKAFVTSKEGKEFLKDYAKKGQTLYGETFTEDGKYHKKGINLNYSFDTNSKKGGEARAKVLTQSGRPIGADINITLGTISTGSGDNIWNSTKTIFHESLIHAKFNAADFLDDRTLNYSNISKEAKEAAMRNERHFHHYQEVLDYYKHEYINGYTKSTRLWPGKAYQVLIGLNNERSVGLTSDQIKEAMWDYNGGFGKGYEKQARGLVKN